MHYSKVVLGWREIEIFTLDDETKKFKKVKSG